MSTEFFWNQNELVVIPRSKIHKWEAFVLDGLVMTRLGIKSFYFLLHTHMYVYMCGCVYIPGKRYKVSKLAILEPNWTVGCKDDIAQNQDALHTHMHVYMCGCVYILGKRFKVSKISYFGTKLDCWL